MKETCPHCGRLMSLTTPPHLPGQRRHPPKLHVHNDTEGRRCDGSGEEIRLRVGAD